MSDCSLKVCLFCASSPHVDERYMRMAADIGDLIAARRWTLVYGGGRRGLMGVAADAALAGGADVIGIIPRHLKDKEVAHTGLGQLEITETMHQRQMRMAALADAFVVLPGGLGTLAEFFEVLTWKQLQLHDKPIYVMAADGYWDSLLGMIDHAAKEKFLHDDCTNLFRVVGDFEALTSLLNGVVVGKTIKTDLL